MVLKRGGGAGGARAVLWMLTPLYQLAVWWRNRRFDSRSDQIHKVDVPVISVGNLTTGGTGKTPFVIWLAQTMRQWEGPTTEDPVRQSNEQPINDLRVSIISRGYGANASGINDEGLEIERRLADVPHLQDPDRFQMAVTAVEELETQLIILDDGFQYLALKHRLDIVLVDRTNPFGNRRMLPRGILREPVRNIKRAGFIFVTKSKGDGSEDLKKPT